MRTNAFNIWLLSHSKPPFKSPDYLGLAWYSRRLVWMGRMVLKFNAALSRFADERFIEKEDLLSKEALLPELVIG